MFTVSSILLNFFNAKRSIQFFFSGCIFFFLVQTVMAACPGFTELTGGDNPLSGVQFSNNGLNSPAFVDIDDDGDLDMFVGSQDGVINFFENTSTSPDAPSFTQRTGTDNPLNSISFASSLVKPSFAFINNDTLPDLIFSVSYEGGVYYYENSGTAQQASFTDKTNDSANPFTGITIDSSPTYFGFKPLLSDIDNDTDMDAVFGMDNGKIKFFENDGTNTFSEKTAGENPFDPISLFDSATPELMDTNNDGDLDLIVGSKNSLKYYQNIGNPESPIYDNGCNIDGASSQYFYPAFGDLYGSGDFRMAVGTINAQGMDYWSVTGNILGDINGINGVELADAILGLKILADMDVSTETINSGADVDSNDIIGLPEVIYVLRKIALQ